MSSDPYVLFVTQYLRHIEDTCQTGGTINNYILLNTLAKHTRVKVLSFDQFDVNREAFLKDGIDCHQVAAPRWRGTAAVVNWQRFVRTQTKQLLHGHGNPTEILVSTSTLSALECCRSAPGTRKNIVIQAYENFGLFPPKVSWQSRVSLGKQAMIRQFSDGRHIRLADRVLTVSEYMKRLIVKRFRPGHDRVSVIPTVCDVGQASYRESENAGTVGFVNRGPDKNLPFVLELARRAPDLTFLVYGHTKGLRPDMPANVKIVGWASDRDSMFRSAGIWIMPSLWNEPFGRVSMEAQASNRPVLVSNLGGLPETVEDSRYVISGFEPQCWLTRIRELQQFDPDRLEAVSCRVRERFSQLRYDAIISQLFCHSPILKSKIRDNLTEDHKVTVQNC